MLIKFGKRIHLQQILDGNLRFTPSNIYHSIEQNQGKKGMGDKWDSYIKIGSKDENGNVIGNPLYFIVDNCDKIPMCCFYNYQKKIMINEFNRLKKDFDNPDSVLLISNQDQFYKNIGNSLGETVFTHSVQYYKNANFLNYNFEFMKSFLINTPKSLTPFILSSQNPSKEYLTIKINPYNSGEQLIKIDSNNFFYTVYFKDIFFNIQNEIRMILTETLTTIPLTKKIEPIKSGCLIDIKEFEKEYVSMN